MTDRFGVNSRLVLLLVALAAVSAFQRQPAPSHVFHHGKIATVDPQFKVVEAMAIRDGRVLATGTNADMLALAAAGTEQVDLGGRTVVPGLIDSHVHAPSASMYEFEQPVPDMQSVEDALGYIRARAGRTEPGQWIVLSQVFITRLREQRYPTRLELDQAAPRHPVAFRTGPDASLNSAALEISGIDAKFRVPDGEPCRVERDAQRRADRHPAELRTLHPVAVHRPIPDHGRSPRPPAPAARRLQLGRHHQHRRRQCRRLGRRAVSHAAREARAHVPHVPRIRRRRAGAARSRRGGDPGSGGASAAPARRHVVAARHQGVPRRRHADRQRLHAPALGRQPDLLDRRSRLSRRQVHRTREAVSDGEARAGERAAVHRPCAGGRGRRDDGRHLRAHQSARTSRCAAGARASPTPAS